MKVGYLLVGYPILTERFIFREVQELLRQGVDLTLFVLRKPPPDAADRRIVYLGGVRESFGAPADALHLPSLALRCLDGESSADLPALPLTRRVVSALSTVRNYPVARKLALELVVKQIPLLHAHFGNIPATIAMMAARLTNIPFSFTAHASDIFTDRALLRTKMRAAAAVVTCSDYTARILESLCPEASNKVKRIYHGIDPAEFEPAVPSEPLVLAVGRMVEKKGFINLVRALGILQKRRRLVHAELIGEGPLKEELLHEAWRVSAPVVFLGEKPYDEVKRHLKRASVFVLPSVIAPDSDRDNIPNVLLEAAASRVPIVTTNTGGIPELIEHGKTGLIAYPNNPEELADRIAFVLDHPADAQALARAAEEHVRKRFSIHENVAQLRKLFEHILDDKQRRSNSVNHP